ncbi:putative SnodProt1 [Venustampulla echinocandica]|uniref:Putative SnodProt1 n=1 Tax=Venustampulla echinocandica TaxID=2656787 RepID=A0A370TXK1_9HELO|nr:putative SnodProt1 [Venustampulla echinocandica]RDL40266.1 putative SnodProt1 [Venustampulla echinocandica]
MRYSIFSAGAALLTTALAVTVSYDAGYDDRGRSLNAVACSNGKNGLITKGFTTQGSLPSFPRIGGAFPIAGWNDPNCGTCYSLTYEGQTVNILAIDHADGGFNIAESVMNTLTRGQAVFLGSIQVDYKRVDNSLCGL